MDPCWFHVCSFDVIFKQVLGLWRHNLRHHQRNTTFVLKLAKLLWYLFIIHIRPNLRSNFWNQRRYGRFQRILCISKLFGSRGEGIEILTIINVQKCQFLAKSRNWTNVYVCCSCKLILNDERLVYIHSLDFLLNTHITKIVQFHIL